jgi:hypothetical protein
MAVAQALNIEPEIERLRSDLTSEDAILLALSANVGGKPWTLEQRRLIGHALYGEGWSQQRIADALNISTSQVSRDLNRRTFPATGNVDRRTLPITGNADRRDSLGRKRSPGRPRKEDHEHRGPSDDERQARAEGRREREEEQFSRNIGAAVRLLANLVYRRDVDGRMPDLEKVAGIIYAEVAKLAELENSSSYQSAVSVMLGNAEQIFRRAHEIAVDVHTLGGAKVWTHEGLDLPDTEGAS